MSGYNWDFVLKFFALKLPGPSRATKKTQVVFYMLWTPAAGKFQYFYRILRDFNFRNFLAH